MFKLIINTDNDALVHAPGWVIANILEDLVEVISEVNCKVTGSQLIKDLNGNTVGRVEWDFRSPDRE